MPSHAQYYASAVRKYGTRNMAGLFRAGTAFNRYGEGTSRVYAQLRSEGVTGISNRFVRDAMIIAERYVDESTWVLIARNNDLNTLGDVDGYLGYQPRKDLRDSRHAHPTSYYVEIPVDHIALAIIDGFSLRRCLDDFVQMDYSVVRDTLISVVGDCRTE